MSQVGVSTMKPIYERKLKPANTFKFLLQLQSTDVDLRFSRYDIKIKSDDRELSVKSEKSFR